MGVAFSGGALEEGVEHHRLHVEGVALDTQNIVVSDLEGLLGNANRPPRPGGRGGR